MSLTDSNPLTKNNLILIPQQYPIDPGNSIK